MKRDLSDKLKEIAFPDIARVLGMGNEVYLGKDIARLRLKDKDDWQVAPNGYYLKMNLPDGIVAVHVTNERIARSSLREFNFSLSNSYIGYKDDVISTIFPEEDSF